MKITYYFVRHGETLFNRKGRVQGVCDSPLTNNGIRQADQVHDAFKEVFFDRIYTSPSERAMDTAAHILEGRHVQPEVINDLHEVDFGKLEGTRFTSHPDEIRHCFNHQDFSSVGGENKEQAGKRALKVMDEITNRCNDQDSVLLVSHGFFEFFIMSAVLGMDVNTYREEKEKEGKSPIPNGGIMVFTYEDGKYSLIEEPVSPKEFKPLKENKTVHFWYMRHGETEFNLYNRIQGWCDSPLTKQGIAQVEETAETLKDIPFDKIYCSTAGRARASAKIMAEGRMVDPIPLRGLKELNFGDYEGIIRDSWKDEIMRRHREGENWDDAGGESGKELEQRIRHTFDKIVSASKDNQNILVVGHGTYYMNILRIFFGMERDTVESMRRSSGHRPMPNAGIFRFDYKDGEYQLVQLMISAEEYREEKESEA